MKITHYNDHRPLRAAAYPSIGDQLDAIWKMLETLHPVSSSVEAEAMRDRIRAVKVQFPKPPNVE
jgi:hypothetical protein